MVGCNRLGMAVTVTSHDIEAVAGLGMIATHTHTQPSNKNNEEKQQQNNTSEQCGPHTDIQGLHLQA